MPALAIQFFVGLLFAAWSTVHLQCLEYKYLHDSPVLILGSLLQVCISCLAIKDGFFLTIFYKRVRCMCSSPRTPVKLHAGIQAIEIPLIFTLAIMVCIYNTDAM